MSHRPRIRALYTMHIHQLLYIIDLVKVKRKYILSMVKSIGRITSLDFFSFKYFIPYLFFIIPPVYSLNCILPTYNRRRSRLVSLDFQTGKIYNTYNNCIYLYNQPPTVYYSSTHFLP